MDENESPNNGSIFISRGGSQKGPAVTSDIHEIRDGLDEELSYFVENSNAGERKKEGMFQTTRA